jgi:hypothetical protein
MNHNNKSSDTAKLITFIVMATMMACSIGCSPSIQLKHGKWIIKPTDKNLYYRGSNTYYFQSKGNDNYASASFICDQNQQLHYMGPLAVDHVYLDEVYVIRDSNEHLAMFQPPNYLTNFDYSSIVPIDSGRAGFYSLKNAKNSHQTVYDVKSKKLFQSDSITSYELDYPERNREIQNFRITNKAGMQGIMDLHEKILIPMRHKKLARWDKGIYSEGDPDSAIQFIGLGDTVLSPWGKWSYQLAPSKNQQLWQHGKRFLLFDDRAHTLTEVDTSTAMIMREKEIQIGAQQQPYRPNSNIPIFESILSESNIPFKNISIAHTSPDSLYWLQIGFENGQTKYGLVNLKSKKLLLPPVYDYPSKNSSLPFWGFTQSDSAYLYLLDQAPIRYSVIKTYTPSRLVFYPPHYAIYDCNKKGYCVFDLETRRDLYINDDNFEDIYPLKNGRLLCVGSKIVVYEANKPLDYYHDFAKIQYVDSVHFVVKKRNGSYALLTNNFKYENIQNYTSFYTFPRLNFYLLGSKTDQSGCYDYYDKNGSFKFQKPFYIADNPGSKNGICVVTNGKKKGLYDFKNQREVLPLIYDDVYPFTDELIRITNKGLSGVVKLRL